MSHFTMHCAEVWVDPSGHLVQQQPPLIRNGDGEIVVDPDRYEAFRDRLKRKGFRRATDADVKAVKAAATKKGDESPKNTSPKKGDESPKNTSPKK